MEKRRTNDINHDRRIIERKIKQGEMTAEELQKYLQDLPDVSQDAEEIFIPLDKKKEQPAEQVDAY